MYSKNKCNARPSEGKNCRAKKKGPGKHTPSVVRKEICKHFPHIYLKVVRLRVCVCVCVECVCVYACVCLYRVYLCVCACACARNARHLPQLISTVATRSFSWTWSLLVLLEWLTSKLGICLSLPLQHWKCSAPLCSTFHTSAGDLNSYPHSWAAHALLTELSLQPLKIT